LLCPLEETSTPYFFILPAFVLAILALSTATIVSAMVRRFHFVFPFAWRVLVWSAAGCILANIPVFALYFLPVGLERGGVMPKAGTARTAVGIALATGLLVGPFVATAAGFFAGAAWGAWRASRQPKFDA